MSGMKEHPSAHSFQIDVTVEKMSLEQALEYLTGLLNGAGLMNFKITPISSEGDIAQIETLRSPSPESDVPLSKDLQEGNNLIGQLASRDNADEIASQIQAYIANRKLVRVVVNKGRGVQESMPCRLINYREQEQMLTVYHVDESSVYTFHLSEIDDFLIYE